MRILLTTQPASGHLRPLVPFGQAAQARGHDVTVCCPALGEEVARYGLAHRAVGYDWRRDAVRHLRTGWETLDFADAADAFRAIGGPLTRDFAGYVARRTAAGILSVADELRPDVVVRELDEMGGLLAAEALGVPHVSVASFGGLEAVTGPALAPDLGVGRAELGLTPDPDGRRAYAHLHASFLPPEYSAAEMILPNTRCYRHDNSTVLRTALPGWLAERDHRRPFVFVGFGTVVYDLPGSERFLQRVITALGRCDADVVVAVGAGRPTDAYVSPANVSLVDFVDQPMMLEGADLFVTHGGLNSMKEALRLGVPMVCLPVLDDHRHNGAQCAANGTAEVIALSDFDEARFADTCTAILTGSSHRAAARAMQRRIHALPSVEQLVDDVETLVAQERRAAAS